MEEKTFQGILSLSEFVVFVPADTQKAEQGITRIGRQCFAYCAMNTRIVLGVKAHRTLQQQYFVFVLFFSFPKRTIIF